MIILHWGVILLWNSVRQMNTENVQGSIKGLGVVGYKDEFGTEIIMCKKMNFSDSGHKGSSFIAIALDIKGNFLLIINPRVVSYITKGEIKYIIGYSYSFPFGLKAGKTFNVGYYRLRLDNDYYKNIWGTSLIRHNSDWKPEGKEILFNPLEIAYLKNKRKKLRQRLKNETV